jgi:hypothetical protein
MKWHEKQTHSLIIDYRYLLLTIGMWSPLVTPFHTGGAYPGKEVLNKTTGHRLVTKYWDTRSVSSRKLSGVGQYVLTLVLSPQKSLTLSHESGLFVSNTQQDTKQTKLHTMYQSLIMPLKEIKRRDSYSRSCTTLPPTITICTTRFNIKNVYVLLRECCCVLYYCHNKSLFPCTASSAWVFCNGDGLCLLLCSSSWAEERQTHPLLKEDASRRLCLK